MSNPTVNDKRRRRARRNALRRLAADGLITTAAEPAPTARWHAALARSALSLSRAGDAGEDMRVPIAMALLGCYGENLDENSLIDCVDVMLSLQWKSYQALQAWHSTP